jgi:protein TonB
MGLEGKVFVKFIIEPDGSISNVGVSRGFDKACDMEAVRVISSMPNWKAGRQDGRAIRQAYTLPIIFKLTEARRR